MRRSLALFVGLALLISSARSDEGIPPDTVVEVKHATVFIRVQSTDGKATGSGFVIAVEKDSVLIATNYHVIGPSDFDKKPRLAPAAFAKSLKDPTVTVVFDGGTKTESFAKAEVIAGDPVNDLAILRVTGLKDPPKPIAYTNPPKLAETMGVYTFGYPFGQALATGKGAPAVTVGKGSVSSLRLDDDGELAVVQIDGALNPGNSGGPVVDTKGQLVGVAVATIRNGQGIGFAVPAAELGKLMKGRLDGFHVTASKAADGKLTVKADVGVLDPTTAVRGVKLHYVVVPPKGAKPKPGDSIAKLPGAKSVELKVAGGVATGELTLETAAGDLYVQAVPDGGAGVAGASRVGNFALTMPKAAGVVVLGPTAIAEQGAGAGEVPAPAGWKEFTPANKTYICWVPDKVKGQSEKSRTSGDPKLRMTFNMLVVDTGGPTYVVEQVIVTTIPRKQFDRDELTKLLRDVVLSETPGAKLTREIDTKMGRFPGKEYLAESGGSAVRARAIIIGSSIYLLRASGTREQVESADSTTFLDSVRLQTPARPPVVATGPIAGGGANDPEFKDAVPAGGTLVGLEIGVGKLGAGPAVRSARAVFMVGDKESYGEWHGAAADANTEKVKIVAKPGYAVGAINAKTTPFIYALSVTFMKVVDGKLDPKDSYESEWYGTKEGFGQGPVTVGGKGEEEMGFEGKKNADTISGVGLLFTDLTKKDPDKGPAVVGPMPPMPPMPPAAVRPGDRGPRIAGSHWDAEFRDHAPPDGVLVGFHIGLGKFVNNDVIKAVRPIYRVGDKDTNGLPYGTSTAASKLLAKPGYAVGAVSVRTGLGIDGMSVTYMKLVDGKLDPKDSYESEWVGGMGGGGPTRIGGDGTLVVGVLGKMNANGKDVSGIGLVYSDTNKPELDGPWPAGKPTNMVGGRGGDPEFREAGPAGSVLVGIEVGVGRFVNNPVVASFRPIFRADGKDIDGEWHGPTKVPDNVKEFVKVVAKPGYAVGAITAKSGLGMDGFSVTFMKVVNGKLDPKDKYESEWVGGQGGGGAVTISGNGALVIGLTGKARADWATAMGLLIAPDKK